MRGVGGLEPPSEEAEVAAAQASKQHVIFILEGARLETGKIGSKFCLLNCDDHKSYLAKKGKDIAAYRPDICHQALMAILDSPLCKTGKVKNIFVHTTDNVVIQVDPQTKLPRTYPRFAGLLVQLLYKFSVRSTNGSGKLLRCVKGPVTNHLPADCQIVGFSRTAPHQLKASGLAKELDDSKPIVFVVGAFSHGQIEVQYDQKEVSISDFPLSAACCIAKLTNALEEKWDIA